MFCFTVVTGCTDGIGKAYTRALAERGIRKFILIGRNLQKLNNVEEVLKSQVDDNENKTCNVWVEKMVFDFATDDHLVLDQFLKEFDVGLLCMFQDYTHSVRGRYMYLNTDIKEIQLHILICDVHCSHQ